MQSAKCSLIPAEALSIGLAMFAMFFGAGNVIFPLAVGQYSGTQSPLAITGLLITAVLIPFAGVFAMILFDGNQRRFFNRLGTFPGFLLALLVISLLGPLGSTPRCIALTYSALKPSLPILEPIPFSFFACTLIYFLAASKTRLLKVIGTYLTPLLLMALATIVFLGFYLPGDESTAVQEGRWQMFYLGLKEGYNTMDLLAAFFFSSTILSILKQSPTSAEREPIRISLQASAIGACLLSLVYIGFSLISSFHGQTLSVTSKDELLSALTLKIAGPQASLLVSITIALACLTTAIALISVFSDFIQKECFKERISYQQSLLASLTLTFIVASFQFNAISAFLSPILQICYPGLIVLTMLNILHQLTGFRPLKGPVFFTFALTAALYFFPL